MPRTYASPIFQHRHYRVIAAAFSKVKPGDSASINEIAQHTAGSKEMARLFAADNPRFDRERFLEACNGRPISPKDKVAS